MADSWRQDVWKMLAIAGGACALALAHRDLLPVLLKPYEGWIELVAFIWTTVHAVRMTPPQTKEPDSNG